MSFGSFNLFNFFQQPNSGALATGALPPITDVNKDKVVGLNDRSGAVADFNWYYPYANTRYSLDLLFNSQGHVPFYLNSDFYFSGSISGLNYLNLQSSISGKIEGNGNIGIFSTSFSGKTNPQRSESGLFQSTFSGEISEAPGSRSFGSTVFSGLVLKAEKDENRFSSKFSGSLLGAGDFINVVNTSFSGIINKTTADVPFFSSSFSGKMIPLSQDNASISFSLFSGGVVKGKVLWRYGSGSSEMSSISYGISSVSISIRG